MIENKLRKFNTGWRYFSCDDCKHTWREATRDCTSPSMDVCPKCQEQCFPHSSEIDLSIPHDALGNLI